MTTTKVNPLVIFSVIAVVMMLAAVLVVVA